jgi:hypothetical protein
MMYTKSFDRMEKLSMHFTRTSFCTPHARSGREQDSMEGQPDSESNKRRRDNQGNWLPADAGATIMAGTGQSIKNVQGITVEISL